jgi:hypothetical protein
MSTFGNTFQDDLLAELETARKEHGLSFAQLLAEVFEVLEYFTRHEAEYPSPAPGDDK